MQGQGSYTDEEFDELCFQFGIELDEITSEKTMAMKEKGATGQESDDVIYKIDIPANRYDLLSLEGLVLALKIFTGNMKPPKYKMKPSGLVFQVDESVVGVRPILLGAVVRGLNLNKELYNSFIDLQDKLHQNIGRKRSIVSIGTHDLDTIRGPFLYTARKPGELEFVPLNETRQFTAVELMEHYYKCHLKPYLPIIKDNSKYPVVNNAKITLNTKSLFI